MDTQMKKKLIILLIFLNILSAFGETVSLPIHVVTEYRSATAESVSWPLTIYYGVNLELSKAQGHDATQGIDPSNNVVKVYRGQELQFSSDAGFFISKIVIFTSTGHSDTFETFGCINGKISKISNTQCEISVTDSSKDIVVKVSGTVAITLVEVYYTEEYYERKSTSGTFGTICLPYRVTEIEGAECYHIIGKIMDQENQLNAIVLEQVTGELEAGTPCIFRNSRDSSIWTYSGDRTKRNIQIVEGLVGHLDRGCELTVPIGCYGISNSKIRKVVEGGRAAITPYRAYIDLSNVPDYNLTSSARNEVILGVNGDIETDIYDLSGTQQLGSGNALIYDLNGIRSIVLHKGLNIIGNKKVIK